ncbi:MAG: phosphoserine transaminase [Gemmatimonadetes bacterium]|nr:phosphoserine transaminase [Gemmatimonadota bacterium]MYC72136.1 phosphoserine transaminase [Gemmatimonadota bacterium]
MTKPAVKPQNPCFSSGPCAKRPGWNLAALKDAAVGRSHRATVGRAKLQEVIERSRALLGVPANYRMAVVPGSDTGAVEMCLWSMLGARGVDVLSWESFSKSWVTDITQHLRLEDVRVFNADFGELPDLSQVNCDRDAVFAWNGTTSGVKVPDGEWIAADREGLTICDATSAIFAVDLPWEKLDVVTYSWQKVMGGEAAHGMLILSPRAVERLLSFTPPWPVPKLFRMTQGNQLNEALFKGDTINTPSLLCVEDALDGLRWAESIGGLPELVRRTQANLAVLEQWEAASEWIAFLPVRQEIRSNTSICLRIADPWFTGLSEDDQRAEVKALVAKLENEGVAYDINGYRAAPPGLRIWGGATVETSDIEALVPWLDWAWTEGT